ncbi:MAG: hypothetical protein SPI83_07760 [Rothia sp. (in: high G+C Gram-positive bacteria)]|nr:hypothetical protein [Rothia sp. (in: high G+C Gram-positive bacteria)]
MSDTVRPSHQLPSESALASIKVWSRLSFLAMVATVASASYPGWLALVTAVLAVLTCVFATVALVKMAGARFPAFSMILMVLLILWSLFLGFAALVQLLFVDATMAYAECLQQAVTLSRQQQCTVQMSDGLLQQLLGQ